MNYELLKLSKILPTINGRRTLDIYQERLDIARKAYQAQQEDQEVEFSQQKSSPHAYGFQKANIAKGNRVQKDKRLAEIRSADRLPASDLNGYSNLNVLLNDEEPFESLANMVGDGFRKKPVKSPTATQMASSGNSFNKKSQNDPTRPSTISSNAGGNFVFKKKKIILRDTNELDHIYHYSLGTGFTVVNNNSLGLSGRKVDAQDFNQVMFMGQQKKDMKSNTTAAFHLPYRDDDSLPQNYEGQMYSSVNGAPKVSRNNEVRDLKAQTQQFKKEDRNSNVKTVMLDGAYLKSFDKPTPKSSAPVSPEKSVKGFF